MLQNPLIDFYNMAFYDFQVVVGIATSVHLLFTSQRAVAGQDYEKSITEESYPFHAATGRVHLYRSVRYQHTA